MKTAADVILALEKTPGKKDKEKIVTDAWNKGILEFFKGTQLAYDALITFGVKKVPLIEDEYDPSFKSTFTWDKFVHLTNQLQERKLTGNAARDALRAAADIADIKEWNGFYRRVILKDFKCGCSESTVNKALEKIAKAGDKKALGYITKVFSCQLAKNGDDHPKKMVGVKLLDPKLDGVRLLTVVDIIDRTVTHYTRNGLINDNFPQIREMFEKIMPSLNQSMLFDGEVVSQTFQAMMKQLKRKSKIDTKDAKLALFDIVPWDKFKEGKYDVSQTHRHEALVQFEPLFTKHMGDTVYVIPKLAVDLNTPEGQASYKEFNNDAVAAGFEGVMLKDPNATYITDRTDAWLKIKPFITVDLEVIGFENGKVGSKHEHILGGMVCRGIDQGKLIEVTVGNGYTDEQRAEFWKHRAKIKGRIIEAKGDVLTKSQNGDTWSLRFPVFVQFRGFKPGEKF